MAEIDLGRVVGLQRPSGARENLLDNWYFSGGGSQQDSGQFPINQRGQVSYSNVGYTIDRWKLLNGSALLTASGLVLNGTMIQIRESTIGLPVTCSALLSDGSMITPTYDDTIRTFTLTATGQTIKAVKLEPGAEQTLAHQENGVWVLNELPNYSEELAKCKRFYQTFLQNGIYAGFNRDNNALWFNIPLPVQMRSTPTVSLQTGSFFVTTWSNIFEVTNPTITAVYNLDNTINIMLQHNIGEIAAFTSVNVLIPGLSASADL